MTDNQRKILDIFITVVLAGLLIWGAWSLFQGKVVVNLLLNNTAGFDDYLAGLGPLASVAYTSTIILEVLIAFIPGYLIYPIGGAVLGVGEAIILSIVGNFIGASICFWIGKKWGYPLIRRFVTKKYLDKWELYTEKHGAAAIFLLKLNPLTSFDIVNYFAGASSIRFWTFSFFNMLGLLPYIVLITMFGEGVWEMVPEVIGVFIGLAVLYVLWFIFTLPRKMRNTFRK
jgi:uncharacterized membrane protein YdjX (TVP38/TMEM64 family)